MSRKLMKRYDLSDLLRVLALIWHKAFENPICRELLYEWYSYKPQGITHKCQKRSGIGQNVRFGQLLPLMRL